MNVLLQKSLLFKSYFECAQETFGRLPNNVQVQIPDFSRGRAVVPDAGEFGPEERAFSFRRDPSCYI